MAYRRAVRGSRACLLALHIFSSKQSAYLIFYVSLSENLSSIIEESKFYREAYISEEHSAVVIGAGPNGLSAAIVLAQAGLHVEVHEAQPEIGGCARTLPLTLPGFLHDFGSAIHPLAVGSPFFSSLPLEAHGLEWIHPPAPLAHPFDDGTAAMLERGIDQTTENLGADGKRWRALFHPLASHWPQLAAEVLGPLLHIPRHPFLMAQFGLHALTSAQSLANTSFKHRHTRALFAGNAAHSSLSLAAPLSSAAGLMLIASAHAVGWPVPRGGAQSITNALASYLISLGGVIHTNSPVSSLSGFPKSTLFLCDVTPRQLLSIAGPRLSHLFQKALHRFQPGPGAFKIDYALSEPIPWKADSCRRAGTVHIGGTLEEIAASEYEMAHGRHAQKPFVLLAQPTLFDDLRAPQGRHIAWAYCHVPNGSSFDMTERIESQIERFAPGFRDCILARHISSPAVLKSMNVNLSGGDINGGAFTLRQTFFRPTWRLYATPDPNIYLCSASTPGMAGVHGMCGYHAAKLALKQLS